MKRLTIISGSLVALALPLVSAAASLDITNFENAGNSIITLINSVLVPLVFALAFIVFLWGAFQTFIVGRNAPDVKEKGKNIMMWGLIGFFVMVSVWGLVNLISSTVNLDDGNAPSGGLPTTPTTGGSGI